MLIILLLITGATTQEESTPASLLRPRNFNYHPYQFLQENEVKPTEKGPVLFPNDGPPPPRRPLVVTSRPLIESIIRSDLNPNPPETNNSIPQPSEINNIFKPYANINQNFGQDLFDKDIPDAFNNVEYQASSYPGVPYADNLKNGRRNGFYRNNDYMDYEERTPLPPIYDALSDHAQQNLLNLQKQKLSNNFQLKKPNYVNHYENNDVSDENHNPEYSDENQNYAFSYTVRDHKTGDDFSHSQQSSGSATNGEYRVRLPDGRTQIVSYTADENGYKADVRYDDEKPKTDYYNTNNNYRNIYNNNPVNGNVNKNNNQNYNTNINNNKYEIPVKENLEQYNSKDYYDYSAEYNNNYQPYKTKFNFNQITTAAPVRPSYDEIKDLFTRSPVPTPLYTDTVSSNSQNLNYGTTTENVVLIGGKNLYNFEPNLVVTTPRPTHFVASTPAAYLASTIASLRDRLTAKPILSNSFINRINKYLTFK
ncbi:uncharacterized protein DDB_G0283357-like [Melitaea cinxia]|uniref:uncharacterized protein DDB_G0283357-like n=1 Tax=Melitaea cinxia TaxID=113334 RepID=UPI001E27253C|nr:uncharacterized protein DDB_G0283357-like [Melitaea cinxia]